MPSSFLVYNEKPTVKAFNLKMYSGRLWTLKICTLHAKLHKRVFISFTNDEL